MSTLTRRPGIPGPGTALLLSDTALYQPKRLDEFAVFSGIPAEDLIISPLCSSPLPVYNFNQKHPGSRRWPGTRPEAMWHPLMWLPNRLAGRYTYVDPRTGQEVREPDDVWVVRVCLELTASGLYDTETGTWVDMIDHIGLDSTNDFDLARIEEWLDGEPDELLDSVDLTEYLTMEPADWALSDALNLLEPLIQASWAMTADELFGQLMNLTDPQQPVTLPDIQSVLAAVCATAAVLLATVPMATAEGVLTSPTPEGHADFFYRIYDTVSSAEDLSESVIDAALEEVQDRCYAIREAFWPIVDELYAPVADGPQGVGA